MQRTLAIVLSVAFLAVGPAALAGRPPLVNFPGDGDLQATKADGETVAAQVEGTAAADIEYPPADIGETSFFSWLLPQRQGIYPPPGGVVSIPVERLNPAEGTICFWFRPDWAVGDYAFHPIVEMDALPAFKLVFKKGGGETVPIDYCYFSMSSAGGCSFVPNSNLFTARQWRHYALRWSDKHGMAQVVVDGSTSVYRTGKFKTGATNSLDVKLNLFGKARGAFAEVEVFDRCLTVEEILKEAGLSKPAQFLDEQKPPAGAAAESARSMAYVDPATGKTAFAMAADAIDGKPRGLIYNPANMPGLPVTEHTPWAKPLAEPPIRILMIMPTQFYDEHSPLREGAELWQRLDCVCDIVDANPPPALFERDYDVIALTQTSPGGADTPGATDWSVLNERFRNWIVERVKTGKSGFILAHPNPKTMDSALTGLFNPKARIAADELVRGIPLKSMYGVGVQCSDKYFELTDDYFADPKTFAESGAEVYQQSKLRAIKLNYVHWWGNCAMGFTSESGLNAAATDVGYDYWQALLVRATLLAARRKPKVVISAASVDSKTWTVKIEGGETNSKLWYRARDIWGRLYTTGEVEVKTPCVMNLDQTKLAPRTVVDFLLKDESGRIIDWFSASAPLAHETKITAVKLGKEAYAKGEDVRGAAEVVTKKSGEYTLTAYLGDQDSRRLVRKDIKTTLAAGETNRIPFTVKIPESSNSLLMRMEVQISKDGEIIDAYSTDCFIPLLKFEGFCAIMPASGNEFCERQSALLFRDNFLANTWMGVGIYGNIISNARNVNTIDICTHLGYPKDEKTLSEFVDNWETFFPAKLRSKELKKTVIQSRPVFYSLGEEHLLESVRSSSNPKVNERFRNYMRGKYGSIEKLNAEWNMKRMSWDEVSTTTPGMPEFERARFMEHLFADKHAYLADYIRKADPLGQVGIHTGWDLWMDRGYDYWLLSRGMDSMVCYAGVQNQYARSFFKNYYGFYYHYSIGYVDNARWCPWEMLINGAHGMAWYTLRPEVWGATTSDLHLGGDWADSWPEFKAVAEAGELLSRTEYIQDQVAIHYSQDSFQAGVGSMMSFIHQAFVNLLFDDGVPFRFVSYDQVAEGELLKKKTPLLIMPHSISLSEKEVAAIREYVNNGGVLWADIVPGEYNNFGRKLKESQMKDLFTDMQALSSDGSESIKKVGKGMVILADIGKYNYDRNVGTEQQTKSLLEAVLKEAKIHRPAKVIDIKTGALANGVWTCGYRSGDQLYAVVARDYKLADKNPLNARMEFEKRGHIYEMRTGKYCGFNNSVETLLETARGQVYALLPYRLEGIALSPAAPPRRGADYVLNVELRTAGGTIGGDDLHLLRITATAPDGKEVTALHRLVKIFGGKGEIRLPLALNDPPGQWTLNLKDTATALCERHDFNLPVVVGPPSQP